MQLSFDSQIPDGLLAANVLLREKPHQGVPSWNLALHQGIDERNSTAAIGLRVGQHLNRAWPRYTGKERDAESGLDYFGARYYASNMGRWMSPDWSAKEDPVPYAKLDNPQTLNLYSYVQNNPIRQADLDGHQEERAPTRDEIELEIREDAEFYRKLSEYRSREITERAEQAARNGPAATPEQRAAIEHYLYGGIGGRWGGTPTRSQNVELADALEYNGFKVTGGGGRAKEELIPGPNGDSKGGTWVDLTAKKGDTTIRIQTVTTMADGKTPTPSEQAAAARIRQAFPKDKLYLIPKQAPTK